VAGSACGVSAPPLQCPRQHLGFDSIGPTTILANAQLAAARRIHDYQVIAVNGDQRKWKTDSRPQGRARADRGPLGGRAGRVKDGTSRRGCERILDAAEQPTSPTIGASTRPRP
jgi:hypothetical protein